MKNNLLLLFTLIFLISCTNSDYSGIPGKRTFKDPPLTSYPRPLWFWNNTTVTSEGIARQMKAYRDSCGYGGFGILAFGENFKPEYLSEEYFEVYAAALENAKKLELQLSLYDEYGFPSGTVGGTGTGDGIGRFEKKFPEQTIKRLDKIEVAVKGPSNLNEKIPQGKLMAVVAMEKTTMERIDLRDDLSDGVLKWSVPEGDWNVMFFMLVKDGYPCVDYLDAEAVKSYTQMIHQEYYKRFSEYFGTVITTSFFDEPWLGRARGRIWTDKFNEKFERKYGFSPEIYYPALWYDIGTETYSARNYLFEFRTELYAKGFIKEVNDWSLEHRVLATGHVNQEEALTPVGTNGDLMKSFKFLEIPGVDKIGGNRPAERFYKIISSAAYNWDKSLIMSETYGAMPNYDEPGDLTWNQIFSIAMDQYAKGINMLIPHAVWYDINNVKYKPELSHRNPLYSDSLKIFNQFLSRLNLILQEEGKHVADIAVLYPIHSLQGDFTFDKAFLLELEPMFETRMNSYYKEAAIPEDDQTDYKIDYVDVANWLTEEACKDFTFLHPEILDEKCRINNGKLIMENAVNQEEFKVLFIPSCKTISLSNLQKIKDFYNEGGHLIFTSQLPSFSVEPGKDEEVREIIDSIISTDELSGSSSKGGKAYFISEPDGKKIRKVLEELNYDYDVDYQGNSNLRYIHRVIEGKDVLYFANTGSLAIETNVKIKGIHNFEVWNPHSGEVDKIISTQKKEDRIWYTELDLNIDSFQSLFLISGE